jgi:O-antigen/teichoic acid export membrane protein
MADISESLGSLARSAGLLMVGAILGRVLGLVGETVIARQLQPELYGKVALAYTIVSALGSLSLLGVHEGLTRLGSADQDPDARRDLVIAAFITVTLGGTVGVGLVTLFAETLAGLVSKPEVAQYLLLLSPFILLYPLSQVVISMLRIQQRSTVTVLTRAVAARIVPLGFLFLAVVAGAGPLIGAAYWLAVPLTIVLLGGILAFRRIEKGTLTLPSQERFHDLWSFSWPIATSSIVFLLLSQVDVLMIGYFLESNDVGYYRAIQPLKQGATIFIGSFSFLFLPLATKAYQGDKLEEMGALFGSATKWGIILTLPIVSTFVFRSREVVVLFFGRPYIEGALPLAVLSGGLFLRTVSGPNGDLVKAINRPGVEARASIVGVLANIGLNWTLIPIYGIAGAAVATVIGYTVYNGIELAVIYRETGVTPFSLAIGKTVLTSTTVLWLFNMALPRRGLLTVIVFGIVSGLVSLLCVVGTQSIEEPDMMLLDQLEDRFGRSFPRFRRVLEWSIGK